jgi:hypothetical protein
MAILVTYDIQGLGWNAVNCGKIWTDWSDISKRATKYPIGWMSHWGWASESGRWDLLGPYACMAWGTRPIVIDEKWQSRSSSEVETKWKVHSRQCSESEVAPVTNGKRGDDHGFDIPLLPSRISQFQITCCARTGPIRPTGIKHDSEPTFSIFQCTQEAPHHICTSIRLDFAPLHIRNIAVRAGPEVRQVSNWKVDCHSHLGCHHDHSDIVTKQCENKECCTSSLQ